LGGGKRPDGSEFNPKAIQIKKAPHAKIEAGSAFLVSYFPGSVHLILQPFFVPVPRSKVFPESGFFSPAGNGCKIEGMAWPSSKGFREASGTVEYSPL